MKRGQITIFVIIGILIISSIALFMYYRSRPGNIDNDIKSNTDNFKATIKDCLYNSAKDSLSIIGFQGGYFTRPENGYDIGIVTIPYYYFEGKNLAPTNEMVEKELIKSMDARISECLKTELTSYKIEEKRKSIKVMIEKDKVDFFVDSQVIVSKDNKIETIEILDFPVSINSRLYGILDIARYITDSQLKDPEYICVTCIDKMSEEQGVYFDMVDFIENNTKQIILLENVTEESGYAFQFLNKYKR